MEFFDEKDFLMKFLSKYPETMIIKQETYQITHINIIITNLLAQIYQNKKIKLLLNKLILQETKTKN